jgi:hypothetical protein
MQTEGSDRSGNKRWPKQRRNYKKEKSNESFPRRSVSFSYLIMNSNHRSNQSIGVGRWFARFQPTPRKPARGRRQKKVIAGVFSEIRGYLELVTNQNWWICALVNLRQLTAHHLAVFVFHAASVTVYSYIYGDTQSRATRIRHSTADSILSKQTDCCSQRWRANCLNSIS